MPRMDKDGVKSGAQMPRMDTDGVKSVAQMPRMDTDGVKSCFVRLSEIREKKALKPLILLDF